MSDFFQINKLSDLHNGSDIIFCKTDFINEEFKNISNIKNDVVLITGNSDYPITDDIVKRAPKNIKKWFAQNALSNDSIIQPIPLGLENKLPSLRENHGIGYLERMEEKEYLLSRNLNEEPTKFIYSNFNIRTNYNYRKDFKEKSIMLNFIDWEENNLTLTSFFDRILEYKMVLCPIGNGVDTHRLWEVLYSRRVPITVKVGEYKIYELYKNLPIIILNSIEELMDQSHIQKLYIETISKSYNLNLLDVNYWKNVIKNG